ncbi:putative RecQ mediated genome instability protein [Leishmania utingensis]|uniref:RecQ-mediated genome instability protein 1 n=1 Tax=Leishmania utingensis TaxID=653362 RepID=A0AAW3AF99_9TRYP
MTALVEEIREKYSLSLSADYVERCLQSKASLTSLELYQKSLSENLRDICGTSLLPYGIATQVSATLPNAVVMQINASRDATQPLRPCADTSEEEAILNAAVQRHSSKRLLRLQLTDGNVELPALELSTLRVFKGIPTPGEKVLIHKDAEVHNGCIIFSESNVSLLGGEVHQLKQDFLAHRRRLEAGYQTSNGLDGAPRFAPLMVGQQYHRNVTHIGSSADMGQHGGTTLCNANGRGRGRGSYAHSGGGAGYAQQANDCYGRRGRGGGHSRGGRGGRGGDNAYGNDGWRSGGRGGGGHGGRGVGGGVNYCGRVGDVSHHVDTANFQPCTEKFPEINEANFPRLV